MAIELLRFKPWVAVGFLVAPALGGCAKVAPADDAPSTTVPSPRDGVARPLDVDITAAAATAACDGESSNAQLTAGPNNGYPSALRTPALDCAPSSNTADGGQDSDGSGGAAGLNVRDAGSGGSDSSATGTPQLAAETACERTIEAFCAAPTLGSPPCIMDWADAKEQAPWCGDGVYVEMSSCANGYNQITRITGAGDSEVFLIYYYDSSSGRLAHISHVPAPSLAACVAGDRALRLDERGCSSSTTIYSCEQ